MSKQMNLEEAISNLNEIIQLWDKEIDDNNKNITAVLDLEDLKSLKVVLQALDNSISVDVIKEKIAELRKDVMKYNKELDFHMIENTANKIVVLEEILQEDAIQQNCVCKNI